VTLCLRLLDNIIMAYYKGGNMLNQPIKLDNVTYEMLSTRCKKKHKKPIDWITHLIQEDYNNGK